MISKKKYRYWVNRLAKHSLSRSNFNFPNKCGTMTLVDNSRLKRWILKRARRALRRGKWGKRYYKRKYHKKKSRKRIHYRKK